MSRAEVDGGSGEMPHGHDQAPSNTVAKVSGEGAPFPSALAIQQPVLRGKGGNEAPLPRGLDLAPPNNPAKVAGGGGHKASGTCSPHPPPQLWPLRSQELPLLPSDSLGGGAGLVEAAQLGPGVKN